MRKALLSGVFGLSLSAPLVAQTFSQQSTYFALIRSAVAGLPPVATSTILGDLQDGVALGIRYGYVPSGMGLSSFNNFGLTAVLPTGTASTVSITGGLSSPSSGGSDAWLVDLAGDMRLTDMPFSQGRSTPRLRVALSGELGYSKPRESGLFSGAVGLPLSIFRPSRPKTEMQIVPFVTPAFVFGNVNPDDDTGLPHESGSHFQIGGGLGLYNRSSSVAVNFGLQYVAVENGQVQLGVVLTLGGR
jgi:hypothetical protein